MILVYKTQLERRVCRNYCGPSTSSPGQGFVFANLILSASRACRISSVKALPFLCGTFTDSRVRSFRVKFRCMRPLVRKRPTFHFLRSVVSNAALPGSRLTGTAFLSVLSEITIHNLIVRSRRSASLIHRGVDGEELRGVSIPHNL